MATANEGEARIVGQGHATILKRRPESGESRPEEEEEEDGETYDGTSFTAGVHSGSRILFVF